MATELKLKQQEEAVKRLEQQISALEKGVLDDEFFESCPDVAKVKAENDRLRYRIQILQQAIIEEEAKESGGPGVFSVLTLLKSLFDTAIRKSFSDVISCPPALIVESAKDNFGDYQCNSAMSLTQMMAKQGIKSSPKATAEKILQNLPPNEIIAKVDVANAGFINIHLAQEEVAKRVFDILIHGVQPPKVARKRVVVDFSSPNIAKEMHVGHLRSTIIGESTCRLFDFVGFDVVRLNHIGDWGTQFGMLIAHLMDKFPNFETATIPIQDLLAFYKESKTRFDSDEEFKKRAYQCVVRLQKHEPSIIKAWKRICDVSRKAIDEIYRRLDITLTERGESFYHDLMPGVVEELQKKGVLVEDQGMKIIFVPDIETPVIVVKSDGGFTYATSDLAALRHRLQEEKADWIIYVVDSGQALHLKQIYAVGKLVGWYDPARSRVEHVGFGVVLGEDKKKFKTRSGETVRLLDLLEEGLKRSKQKLQEKGRDKVLTEEEFNAAQEAVAYGCIKYADLCHSRQNDYIFSFDKMLDDRGNTAVYLLYAYTRMRSIARGAQLERADLVKSVETTPFTVSHPKEFKLAKALLRFPDVVSEILNSLQMHPLCEYLYVLATVFSEFYDNCYCIEKNESGGIKHIHVNRMILCEATADTLASGLRILGVRTVEKM